MLTKLIDTSSFYHQDEPLVFVIDTADIKGLTKQAADSRIMDFASGIQTEPNKIYLHILAMGAGEFFGANRNADYFPEHNLIDYHHTFVTSPAHIFRNHVNKDSSIAIGKVLYSIYNDRMHRVEVIAEVDTNKAPDIKQRVDDGEWPATSMACRTPFDVCSICGNKAHTRQEYCTHIKNDLGKIFPDGRKVMALNTAPLKFFDMSIVFRPADVTSSVLQKVASENTSTGFDVSSVYAAEIDGLDKIAEAGTMKKASMGKISEHIKEIEGDISVIDNTLENILNKVKDPDPDTVPVLRNYKLNDIFSTMGHLGISPSVSYLAELISQKMMGDKGTGLGDVAASMINSVGHESIPSFDKDFGDLVAPNFGIVNVLLPHVPTTSYLPEYVEKRAYQHFTPNAMPAKTTANTGYAMNGPLIEPTPYEIFKREQMAHHGGSPSGIFKAFSNLLAIGSAALAAKWYITKVIEQKMAEKNIQNQQEGVKIVLVKTSSDYALAYKLAKVAMLQAFRKTVKSK